MRSKSQEIRFLLLKVQLLRLQSKNYKEVLDSAVDKLENIMKTRIEESDEFPIVLNSYQNVIHELCILDDRKRANAYYKGLKSLFNRHPAEQIDQDIDRKLTQVYILKVQKRSISRAEAQKMLYDLMNIFSNQLVSNEVTLKPMVMIELLDLLVMEYILYEEDSIYQEIIDLITQLRDFTAEGKGGVELKGQDAINWETFGENERMYKFKVGEHAG